MCRKALTTGSSICLTMGCSSHLRDTVSSFSQVYTTTAVPLQAHLTEFQPLIGHTGLLSSVTRNGALYLEMRQLCSHQCQMARYFVYPLRVTGGRVNGMFCATLTRYRSVYKFIRKLCNPAQLTTDGSLLYGPQFFLDTWARDVSLLLHSWSSRSLPGYRLKVDAHKILSAITLETLDGVTLNTSHWEHAPGVNDDAVRLRLEEIETSLRNIGRFTPQAHRTSRMNIVNDDGTF